ncbi:laccase, multicopper oxidase, benzenediol:oxygen oxidorectuctase [Termitomyces sp. 'cryptogamus']|nr:laccase, multicopper oxidase, benzenediol:oxygen oxidorectuctase [Termitomyces sp. 'cryptogamus']
MFSFGSFLVAYVLAAAVHAAIGPSGDMYIVNADISPDGFTRPAVLAGSSTLDASHPGVLVTAKKGDRMKMNVINLLRDATMFTGTSIHWHGLFQKGSSWADGPAGVNQCPITPNNSFLYDFDVGDQAGTYWYHSHLGTQYCDGLRGAIVIYDPKDPFRHLYDVDDETTVITLADWYHIRSTSVTNKAMFDTTLINGLGRNHNGKATKLAVVNVVYGKRYRFRIVSVSCDPNFIFSIDAHNMTIIEVDGVNHMPLTVDSLQIFSGQRYSVVVAALQPINNYWIRALPNLGYTTFERGINSAIFRYSGAAIEDPTTTNSSLHNPLVETKLHPLDTSGAPGGSGPADISLCLHITHINGRFAINGASFEPPSLPVLLQIMSGVRSAQSLLPIGNVYTLPRNKTIELIMPGGSSGAPHPFHLHGHNFDVVRSAGSAEYNYHNPVRRDVVSTGFAGDNVTIRFTTNNPGPWFLHCHIDWHLDNGLAIVFAEDVDTIEREKKKVPNEWKELCPMYQSAH